MLKKSAVASLFAGFMFAASAHATVINFEADALGARSNGFSSVSYAGVHFSDSMGQDLRIGNWGDQGHGRALGVFADDSSQLIINFDFMVNALSLAFGNDDPGWSSRGDRALLTLFNGATQVGQSNVVMNRNDIMDQLVSFSGADFNRATFGYVHGGTPINLTEIVDDVTFTRSARVPEPSMLALLGIGLAGFGALRAKRKA